MGRGKRYSGKSSINVQSMDTGADVLANTMASGFAKFKDIGLEYLNKKAIERGQESAGKTPLQKKTGSRKHQNIITKTISLEARREKLTMMHLEAPI